MSKSISNDELHAADASSRIDRLQGGRNTVRAPTSADAMVGYRIRALRSAAGLTQKRLAARIGVTNTQLHRYESGATRVAASRLIAIAETLCVGIEQLIETPPANAAADAHRADLHDLQRAYIAIKDPQHRKALLSLAHSMAGGKRGRDGDEQARD